ncbi:MAG: hypothetical protein SCALA702_36270 [Melioribacteraceae bacterium]|nr:MAG: hypothetical protein SCALA702_36270 [Melioribacteraceae bacterium]
MGLFDKIAAILTVIISMILSFTTSAQDLATANFTEKSIGNLEMGISSDNYGLKRSSIYFAGKYRVAEVADVMLDEMKRSDDVNIKCLMAVALYQIKDDHAMEYIVKLSRYASDSKLRKTCKAIAELYTVEKSEILVQN